MKTTLNCKLCGNELNDDAPSIAGILRNCGPDTVPAQQANILLKKHHCKKEDMYCDRCFWLFEGVKKPKKINKFWTELAIALAMFMLIVEIMMFGLCIFQFMSGFHSLDLAQDVTQLTFMLGGDPKTVSECAISGECFSLHDTYLMGMGRMFYAFFGAIMFSFLISANIFALYELLRGAK